MPHQPEDADWFGDLRPILDGWHGRSRDGNHVDDDLAAFVRAEDRGRSLTVVYEVGGADPTPADLQGEARRIWNTMSIGEDACPAVQRAADSEHRADGKPLTEMAKLLKLVRLAEQGHHGAREAAEHWAGWCRRGMREQARMIAYAVGYTIRDGLTAEQHKRCCRPPIASRKLHSEPDEDERGIGNGETPGQRQDGPAAEDDDTPRTQLSPYLLPDSVWEFSTLTAHVYQAAMARIVSPDALLHVVITIVTSLLNYGSRVETGKGRSTLTSYLAPVGVSGGGKDEAINAGRDLLEDWTSGTERFAITGDAGWVDDHLGSGEGLIDAFLGDVLAPMEDAHGKPVLDGEGNQRTEKVRAVVRHNALFADGEGRRVLALDARKGSSLFPRLCDLYSGNSVGERNCDAGGRSRKLPARSTVVGVILGFQIDTVDALFDDAAGGTPQRFRFASAEYAPHAADLDSEVIDEWPGQLQLKVSVEPITVTLAPEQQRYVRRAQRAKAGGVSLPDVPNGPLDGHRVLDRCRLAAVLTILHGDGETELVVPPEIWELSGLLVDHSAALRDWLADNARRKLAAQRQAQQDAAVETTARAHAVTERITDVARVARLIVARVQQADGRTLTLGRAVDAGRKYSMDVRQAALKLAVDDGRLSVSPDGKSVTAPEDVS